MSKSSDVKERLLLKLQGKKMLLIIFKLRKENVTLASNPKISRLQMKNMLQLLIRRMETQPKLNAVEEENM